jgi:hypothetical protein
MRRAVTLEHLKDASPEELSRDLERRLLDKYAPHRLGDGYPQVSVNDWAILAALVLRIVNDKNTEPE